MERMNKGFVGSSRPTEPLPTAYFSRPSAKKLKLNSVAFSPQANYTDRAAAAY
jgi:hypothetical protein